MDSRYDIYKLISQRENAEMPGENEDLVSAALAISRSTGYGGKDEDQPEDSAVDVILQNVGNSEFAVKDIVERMPRARRNKIIIYRHIIDMTQRWKRYLETIRESKPSWNRQVSSEEMIRQQRMLNESLGTENPYLGMSWQELKSLGHGLRTSAL